MPKGYLYTELNLICPLVISSKCPSDIKLQSGISEIFGHFQNVSLYILECADGSYYTGSTTELKLRLAQHQAGEGANHNRKRLPVRLLYYEEYSRIDDAFYREKQIQGWDRKKKEALIEGKLELLPELAKKVWRK